MLKMLKKLHEMNTKERLRFYECFTCEHFDRCFEMDSEPEEYEDGSCRRKILLDHGVKS